MTLILDSVIDGERMCVYVRARVCVCVCVRERENVCVPERECVCVRESRNGVQIGDKIRPPRYAYFTKSKPSKTHNRYNVRKDGNTILLLI